jgi:hypothetical protein
MTDPTANSSPEPQKRPVDPRAAYKPITLEDVRQKEDEFFKDMDTPVAKGSAAMLFAAIFFLGRNSYLMSPLLVVILLACVLYRMNRRERSIAAIPLTFAAIRLGTALSDDFTLNAVSTFSTILRLKSTGVTWLPLFLAAVLFYAPWKHSRTSQAIFWQSLVYLMSGLLPLDGFFVVSTMLTFSIFFVITITLILDLTKDWLPSDLPVVRILESAPAHS